MSVEFADTNLLVYAHDGGAGPKHDRSVALLERLVNEGTGAVSVQVLAEFYVIATRKLEISSREAQMIIEDLGGWTIHRPSHGDLVRAAEMHRRYRLSWRDTLIVNSALELGCSVLWSEDLSNGQRFGAMQVRNPFV